MRATANPKATTVFLAGWLAVTLAITGCGGGDARSEKAGFTPVHHRSIAAVPVDGDVVLTIGNGKADHVELDLSGLEALGLVESDVFEPFDKERITFAGVELRSVLDAADVPSSADVRLVALDDYVINLTADEIDAGGILLATRSMGELIDIAEGGPSRVVFLDGTESGEDENQWIWSVARIDISS